MRNAILRARRLRLVLGVKDLGLGLGLGLGSFAQLFAGHAQEIYCPVGPPLVVSLPCARCARIALYTALFTVHAQGEYHRAYKYDSAPPFVKYKTDKKLTIYILLYFIEFVLSETYNRNNFNKLQRWVSVGNFYYTVK